jgi:hypothetical protein
MDNFFALFRRYLNEKAKGNTLYVCLALVECQLLTFNFFIVIGTASPHLLRAKLLITLSLETPSQLSF